MTQFLMGVFAIQALGGLYQMGSLAAASFSGSTARATHLSDLLVFSHAVLGFLATGLWLGQLVTGNDAYAWVTLVVVLLAVGGGTVLFVQTEFGSETVQRPAVDQAGDPADVRVAEKQIPKSVLHAHGLGAVVVLFGVLAVAL